MMNDEFRVIYLPTHYTIYRRKRRFPRALTMAIVAIVIAVGAWLIWW